MLVLPGADTDEILIARALGAIVGRVETAVTAVLARLVLGGGADIVPLPDDRMTVRAFLRNGWRPPAMGDIESIARELHICYVQRQRERNVAVGPALEPWESLSPVVAGIQPGGGARRTEQAGRGRAQAGAAREGPVDVDA